MDGSDTETTIIAYYGCSGVAKNVTYCKVISAAIAFTSVVAGSHINVSKFK